MPDRPTLKGRRKYHCDECKAESFHHWIERNRSARMRCPSCGSARLDLCSAEAKAEQSDLNAVRVEGHPSMITAVPTPKKIVMASGIDHKDHKDQ